MAFDFAASACRLDAKAGEALAGHLIAPTYAYYYYAYGRGEGGIQNS